MRPALTSQEWREFMQPHEIFGGALDAVEVEWVRRYLIRGALSIANEASAGSNTTVLLRLMTMINAVLPDDDPHKLTSADIASLEVASRACPMIAPVLQKLKALVQP